MPARPPSSAVPGSAGGYRGWRLPRRPPLAPWGRREVHWACGSDPGPLIFFLSGRRAPRSAGALPAGLWTNFSPASSFPAEAGPRRAARAPIGRAGGGGARAVRVPPRRVGTLSVASPRRQGGKVAGSGFRASRWRRGETARGGESGKPGALPGPLVAPLDSASRGPALEPASVTRCLPLPGLFLAPLHAGRKPGCWEARSTALGLSLARPQVRSRVRATAPQGGGYQAWAGKPRSHPLPVNGVSWQFPRCRLRSVG